MYIYMCLHLFKFVLSWLDCKPFIFRLWNLVSPNPSVNNSPVRSHNLWLFRSTVDSIFRTITAFCAYPENVFFFPQLSVWTAKWQIFLQICICVFTYCFMRITLYVAFLNPPLSWNTSSSQLMCLSLSFLLPPFQMHCSLSFNYWTNCTCCG